MVARTFASKVDAQGWLNSPDFDRDSEDAPAVAADPFLRDYAAEFLVTRQARGKGPLKPRTREHYAKLLDSWILPALGDLRLSQVTTRKVDQWFADADETRPTMRAHAYSLLHGILANAVRQGLLDRNPANIEGAGQAERKVTPVVLSATEVFDLAEAMPGRYRAMVYLAVFGSLRFGEVTELRRRDLDLARATVHVDRAVTRAGGAYIVGAPKSAAGRRSVDLPREVLPVIAAHLDRYVAVDPDALLFPARDGGHLAPSTLYKSLYKARTAIGRPDLRWHDLRHTSGTLTAHMGATLAELQARLGHSTVKAAMTYQHATEDRGRVLADRLGEVIEIESRRRTADSSGQCNGRRLWRVGQ